MGRGETGKPDLTPASRKDRKQMGMANSSTEYTPNAHLLQIFTGWSLCGEAMRALLAVETSHGSYRYLGEKIRAYSALTFQDLRQYTLIGRF